MKLTVVVVFALVAYATAAAVDEPPKILRSEFEHKPEGGYVYGFETENGINRNENAEYKQVLDEDKKPHDVLVVKGSYSYINNDGNVESINYSADEFGFRAEGESIPKAVSRK